MELVPHGREKTAVLWFGLHCQTFLPPRRRPQLLFFCSLPPYMILWILFTFPSFIFHFVPVIFLPA